MSMADALTRITQIQAQIAGLTQGTVPAGSAAAAGMPTTGGQDPSAGVASGADFQAMLARAQGGSPAGGAAGYAPYGSGGSYSAAASGSAYGAIGSGVPGLGGSPIGLTGGVGFAAGAGLPAA